VSGGISLKGRDNKTERLDYKNDNETASEIQSLNWLRSLERKDTERNDSHKTGSGAARFDLLFDRDIEAYARLTRGGLPITNLGIASEVIHRFALEYRLYELAKVSVVYHEEIIAHMSMADEREKPGFARLLRTSL